MTTPTLLIDTNVKKIQYIFLWTGINIKSEEKTCLDKYRRWCMLILNVSFLICEMIAEVVSFLKSVENHQSFMELTYKAPCIIIILFGAFKLMNLLMAEGKIEALLELLRVMETEQQSIDKDLNTEKIIKRENKFLNDLLYVLNRLYPISCLFFQITPILLMVYKYSKSNEVELILPLSASYPFDSFDLRYYPWVYLHQCRTVTFVSLYMVASDFLYYIFCSNLIIQFHLLQYNLERVIPFGSRPVFLVNKEQINLKMRKLVQWHQRILRSAQLLEIVYTKSMLFNFVTSSSLICFTGFNVVEINAYSITFLGFLLVNLTQIFLLCFYGDHLKESSLAVGNAVYSSKWYLADTQLRKTMLLILIRSQTPCNLTAWGYADVNLNGFMKICSTAWSYFALLQTVHEQNTE